MPWVRAKLRGKVVFARANSDGSLRSEGGRVEIRYNRNDGRLYRAAARNLAIADNEVLADDHCGEAAEVQRSKDKQGGTATAQARKKKAREAFVPPSDGIIAYTDGACSGNPGPAGLGVVVLYDGEQIEVSEYLGRATNNIAELEAIAQAIAVVAQHYPDASEKETIHIHTDSKYAIGVLTKGWKAKANRELIHTIRDTFQRYTRTKLSYVPGHAGVAMNERADELARSAVESKSNAKTIHKNQTT